MIIVGTLVLKNSQSKTLTCLIKILKTWKFSLNFPSASKSNELTNFLIL